MSERNCAIIVGVNSYFDDFIPKEKHLKYAVNDALKMQEFLCKEAQFPESHVLLCCDTSAKRPTRTQLRDLLRNRLKQLRADNLWFFFAGHGIVHEGTDYLLPNDGNPDDLTDTAIPINLVTDCLQDSGAKNIVLALDMCRDRMTADGRRGGGELGKQTLEIAKERGIVTLYSCGQSESSYEIDDLKHGAFTYVLLEGLKQSTTPRSLESYLRREVPALNKRNGKPLQIPQVIPSPGWKYDLPLLLNCATAADIKSLIDRAKDAELDEDYELAESLLWQVNRASSATLTDRALVEKRIKKIVNKRNQQPSPLSPPVVSSPVPPPLPPAIPTIEFKVVTIERIEKQPDGQNPKVITTSNQKKAEYQTVTLDGLGNALPLQMILVPGGTFTMGSLNGELDSLDDEKPQHKVTVPKFYMSRYPITQAQWKVVARMGNVERDLKDDPSHFKGDNFPVESVSWHDAIEFCNRLAIHTNHDYRLPSEAEWEYACRAGTATPFHFGETITTDLANYRGTDWDYQGKTYPGFYGSGPRGEYRQGTTPVDNFKIANAFGLSDMHGNVWEWCADNWHDNYDGAPTDGEDWLIGNEGANLVLRGGSWFNGPRLCRSAFRDLNQPNNRGSVIGLRVVCSLLRT
jgi:formylglycine-generating enzyme required for sulfatase activity/uncharacterized caspase-like protein